MRMAGIHCEAYCRQGRIMQRAKAREHLRPPCRLPSAANPRGGQTSMPRIAVFSDLHLEHASWQPPPGLGADLVILAGDIWTKGRLSPWPDATAAFGAPVVLIPGNHEFYGAAIDTEVSRLKAMGTARSVTVLDNDEIIVNGIRVLGATLWADFRLFAGDNLAQVKSDAAHCVGDRYSARMMDFWSIRVAKDGYRRFRPKDAALLHQQSVAWLRERLAVPFDGPTVVATHHAPSIRCLPDWARTDRFSCAYASHLDGLIETFQPDVWFWGHVHEAVAPFRIGRTLMASNPRGYAPGHLNPRFDPTMVVEVG